MENNKVIIHNCSDLPDETCIEMVLRVVHEGKSRYGYPAAYKFRSGYEVQSKRNKNQKSDTFYVVGGGK